jgi:hypothetical protein
MAAIVIALQQKEVQGFKCLGFLFEKEDCLLALKYSFLYINLPPTCTIKCPDSILKLDQKNKRRNLELPLLSWARHFSYFPCPLSVSHLEMNKLWQFIFLFVIR